MVSKENFDGNEELINNKCLVEVIKVIDDLRNKPILIKSDKTNSVISLNLEGKVSLKKDKKNLSNDFRDHYTSLIHMFMNEMSFYGQKNKQFNYDDYSIASIGKKQSNFQDSDWKLTKKSNEKRQYDAPLVENSNLDKFLGKIIMMQNMGQATSDYKKPDGMSIDEFERINNYKKVNAGWIKIKYSLVSVS